MMKLHYVFSYMSYFAVAVDESIEDDNVKLTYNKDLGKTSPLAKLGDNIGLAFRYFFVHFFVHILIDIPIPSSRLSVLFFVYPLPRSPVMIQKKKKKKDLSVLFSLSRRNFSSFVYYP